MAPIYSIVYAYISILFIGRKELLLKFTASAKSMLPKLNCQLLLDG